MPRIRINGGEHDIDDDAQMPLLSHSRYRPSHRHEIRLRRRRLRALPVDPQLLKV